LYACSTTPYVIAFQASDERTPLGWLISDTIVDFLFFIDMILNFFMAYYDSEYRLVDSRRTIAVSYLKSWFAIDVAAVIPFDLILRTSNYNSLARIDRIPKLYKLIKMSRLVRMLKIVKDRNKLVKYLNEVLKIGIGFERLLFFLLIFLVLCHVVSCIWIMTANFADMNPDTWVIRGGYERYSNFELYITAFYFTITTITTVGFGDISGGTTAERILCIVLMIIGVVSFSFATGSLSSLLSNLDASHAQLKQKITTLNEIRAKYGIEPEVYDEIRKAIKYDHSKNQKDIINFIEELPHKLKVQVAMQIHKEIYTHIKLFQGKEEAFIVWIGPLLKPFIVEQKDYIFKESDPIKERNPALLYVDSLLLDQGAGGVRAA